MIGHLSAPAVIFRARSARAAWTVIIIVSFIFFFPSESAARVPVTWPCKGYAGVLVANFSTSSGFLESSANRQLVIQDVALHVGTCLTVHARRTSPFLFLLSSKEVDLSTPFTPDVSKFTQYIRRIAWYEWIWLIIFIFQFEIRYEIFNFLKHCQNKFLN